MDLLKLLRGYLAKTLKMADGDIDAILNAENTDENAALAALLDKDKTRVQSLTQHIRQGQTFQDGYKKAKAEVMEQFEAKLKEAHGLTDSTAEGVDLVDEILSAKGGTSGKLTDDDVRKHPLFLDAERGYKKTLKDKDTEWQKKLDEANTNFNKTSTLSKIKSEAIKIRNDLKPVIPGNATIAANLENSYLSNFEKYDYEIQGDRIVVMEGGKVKTDDHGNTLEFADLVKGITPGYYEFSQNNGGSNAGNGSAGATPVGGQTKTAGSGAVKGYPAGINKPASIEDYARLIADKKISIDDRNAVREAWKAEHPSGEPAPAGTQSTT